MRKIGALTATTAGRVSSGRVNSGVVSMTGSSGTAARVTRRAWSRRWPAVVGLVAALPSGVLAADSIINSADLLLWGSAALFVWGVSR